MSWAFCCWCWPLSVGLSTRRRERKRKKEARLTLSSVPYEANGENSDRTLKIETYPGLGAQGLPLYLFPAINPLHSLLPSSAQLILERTWVVKPQNRRTDKQDTEDLFSLKGLDHFTFWRDHQCLTPSFIVRQQLSGVKTTVQGTHKYALHSACIFTCTNTWPS